MNSPKRIILLGGGGHAAVVADAARSSGLALLGYLDDQERPELALQRFGAIADWQRVINASSDGMFHAAVGSNQLRKQWLEAVGPDRLATIVHPSAVVSPDAAIAAGAFIGPLAIVNARASIGCSTIINSGAIIEHDCCVGPFSHIAPRAVLCGSSHVGCESLVGSGAVVLPGVRIGDNATLGAGAVATADVADRQTAVGVPARIASLVL